MNSTGLKLILFDIGNVLLKFDHQLMFAQLGELAGVEAKVCESFFEDNELHLRFEKGLITANEVYNLYKKETCAAFDFDAFAYAISDIFEVIESTASLARRLKNAGYQIALGSNTNEAHMRFARERFAFFDDFDEWVFSYELGVRKPEQEFYKLALERCGVTARECVFIDDLEVNCAAARQMGLTAITYVNFEQLVQELFALGVRPAG